MTTNTCLNCEKPLIDKFCHGCGQKADTHRISLKNFLFHDLLHGTFHIERGMLFTANQALFRPGKAALDYIAGKRKRYYNVFYLILITIGVLLFVRHLFGLIVNYGEEEIIQHKTYINEASRRLDEIFEQKSKILLLLYLPCAALNSFILFRRKKLNLSEHMILSGMIFQGILLVSIFGHFLFYLNLVTHFGGTFLSLVVTGAILAYVGFGYYNAFSDMYSKWGITYRIFLFFVLICLEIVIMLMILMGIASDWKFGQITIAPFS